MALRSKSWRRHTGQNSDKRRVNNLTPIGTRGAVSDLVEALENVKDFKRRRELIDLLGQIGPDASDAIKPLETALAEEKLPGTKTAIRNALAKIRKKK